MSYVIKSCFRLSSIAAVHLRKSWTSLAPMTPRIKPGSHRELIFRKFTISAVRIPSPVVACLLKITCPDCSPPSTYPFVTLFQIFATPILSRVANGSSPISPSIYFSSAASTSVIIPAKVTSDLVCMICGEYFVGFAAKAVCSEIF